jgi:hypothetical protein
MSQKPTCSHSGLNAPAKKFFAAQIRSCIQANKEASVPFNGDEWTYKCNVRSPISFSQIWVQGIVVLVSADGNDMLLDDGTGIIYVTGITKLLKNVLIAKGKNVNIT